MTDGIEPRRSDPSGWIPWVAVFAGLLVFALAFTLATLGGDGEVGTVWILVGIGALVMAGIGLPAWAVFGLKGRS